MTLFLVTFCSPLFSHIANSKCCHLTNDLTICAFAILSMSTQAQPANIPDVKWKNIEWDPILLRILKSGELNIDTLNKAHLEPICKRYFPGYKYKNFNVLIKRRVSAYRVERQQAGHRKRRAEAAGQGT